jgi:hypothetical protein
MDKHKEIIHNIVWKEKDNLRKGQKIEFKWGRKRFIIKRIK